MARKTVHKQKQHKLPGCPVGRPYNPEHPTCKSCPIECSAPRKRPEAEAPVRTWTEGQVLITTAYLFSYNHWHGRPRYIYSIQKRKWKGVFNGCWALWGKQKDCKRKITVLRQVTQEEHLIKDDDNLMTTLKPVLDSLKQEGVIIDDASNYIKVEPPVQRIGDQQMVMISVTDLDEPIILPSAPRKPRRDKAKAAA